MFARRPDPNEVNHPEGNSGANLQSIFHRCYLRDVAFEWELTQEPIYLPLGCLQGGDIRRDFAGHKDGFFVVAYNPRVRFTIHNPSMKGRSETSCNLPYIILLLSAPDLEGIGSNSRY